MASLRRKLWKIFSEWVRRKDADHAGMVACVSCGAVRPWQELQAGHYLPKSLGGALYFEERNVHPQDSVCNLTLQGNQYRYGLYLVEKYGPNVIQELEALRRLDWNVRADWYLEKIAHYQQKLKDLGNHGLTDRSAA